MPRGPGHHAQSMMLLLLDFSRNLSAEIQTCVPPTTAADAHSFIYQNQDVDSIASRVGSKFEPLFDNLTSSMIVKQWFKFLHWDIHLENGPRYSPELRTKTNRVTTTSTLARTRIFISSVSKMGSSVSNYHRLVKKSTTQFRLLS